MARIEGANDRTQPKLPGHHPASATSPIDSAASDLCRGAHQARISPPSSRGSPASRPPLSQLMVNGRDRVLAKSVEQLVACGGALVEQSRRQ